MRPPLTRRDRLGVRLAGVHRRALEPQMQRATMHHYKVARDHIAPDRAGQRTLDC